MLYILSISNDLAIEPGENMTFYKQCKDFRLFESGEQDETMPMAYMI